LPHPSFIAGDGLNIDELTRERDDVHELREYPSGAEFGELRI
jgi:hypothetical protein